MLPGNGTDLHVSDMSVVVEKEDAVHGVQAARMTLDHVGKNIVIGKIACIKKLSDNGISEPTKVGLGNILRYELAKINPSIVMMFA